MNKRFVFLLFVLIFLIVDPVNKIQLIYNGYIRYKVLQKLYPDSDSDLNSHIRHCSWNRKTYIDFINHNQNKHISYFLIRGSGYLYETMNLAQRTNRSNYMSNLIEASKDLESNRKGLEIYYE